MKQTKTEQPRGSPQTQDVNVRDKTADQLTPTGDLIYGIDGVVVDPA